MDFSNLKKLLSGLLPDNTVIAMSLGAPADFELHPEEQSLTGSMAKKRLEDFKSSRYVASLALNQLGYENFPLLINQHRGPVWPRTVVGSLTHCDGIAFAVANYNSAVRSIGIDLEAYTTMAPNLYRMICSEQELTHLQQFEQPELMAKVIFSVKESIYKCLNPLLNEWIDFKDVSIELDPQARKYRAAPNSKIAAQLKMEFIEGGWLVDGEYLYSCCWLNGSTSITESVASPQ